LRQKANLQRHWQNCVGHSHRRRTSDQRRLCRKHRSGLSHARSGRGWRTHYLRLEWIKPRSYTGLWCNTVQPH